jgi:hypothetical protein
MLTVNAVWNIWNFRQPVLKALFSNGHRVTVLAPPDDSVPQLEKIGCRVLPLTLPNQDEIAAEDRGRNPNRHRRTQLQAGPATPIISLKSYTNRLTKVKPLAMRRCGI